MADNSMAASWQGNGSMQQSHRGFDNMKKDSAWRDVLAPGQGGGRRSMPHDGEEKGWVYK